MANEYLVNNADLLAVANAIREKAESTDGLVFPSGFVEAISGIESGGGYPIAWGSFTLITDTTDYIVTHNLGIVPDLVFYWGGSSKKSTSHMVMAVSKRDNSVFTGTNIVPIKANSTSDYYATRMLGAVGSLDTTKSSGSIPCYGGAMNATESTFTLCDSGEKSGLYLHNSLTYNWVAIGGLT